MVSPLIPLATIFLMDWITIIVNPLIVLAITILPISLKVARIMVKLKFFHVFNS